MSKRKNGRRAKFGLKNLIFPCILIIVAIATFFIFQSFQGNHTNTPTHDTSVQNTSPEETPSEAPVGELEEEIDKTPVQFEGENPNTQDNLSGSITAAFISGEKAIIRVNIDQFLSTGSCELVLTSGNQTYSESARIIPEASTSTCEGFDIPLEKISTGTWQILINLSSDSKTGQITGGELVL